MNSLTDYAKPAAGYAAAGVISLGGVMFANKLNYLAAKVLGIKGSTETVSREVYERLKDDPKILDSKEKNPMAGFPKSTTTPASYTITWKVGAINETVAQAIGGIAGAAIAYFLVSSK